MRVTRPVLVSTRPGGLKYRSGRTSPTKRRPSGDSALGARGTGATGSVLPSGILRSALPSRGTLNRWISEPSMPRTRIFAPEGSATTPSPTRILRASGVADPAEGTLHTTPRAAKKIVLPSGAQASDTTGPFPDARVRTRRPEAGSAIRDGFTRFRPDHERNFARSAGGHGSGRFLGRVDQRRWILPFLHHHQAELRRCADRKDSAAVGEDRQADGVGQLRKARESFEFGSVRGKAYQVRRPVHDTGVDALAQAGFGVPNRAGGGDQFASCAGAGGGNPVHLGEGSGVDEGDQGLVVAG